MPSRDCSTVADGLHEQRDHSCRWDGVSAVARDGNEGLDLSRVRCTVYDLVSGKVVGEEVLEEPVGSQGLLVERLSPVGLVVDVVVDKAVFEDKPPAMHPLLEGASVGPLVTRVLPDGLSQVLLDDRMQSLLRQQRLGGVFGVVSHTDAVHRDA